MLELALKILITSSVLGMLVSTISLFTGVVLLVLDCRKHDKLAKRVCLTFVISIGISLFSFISGMSIAVISELFK